MPGAAAAGAPGGRKPDRTKRPKLELRGRAVRLQAEPAKPWPRWMQIAGEGIYLGHPSGPFEFNEKVFGEIIANFRALPEYRPGPDGVGAARVIPYDAGHRSERRGASVEEIAAEGWIWDLDARKLQDGSLGLFALSEMLEPARTLIDEEKLAWTSVCVWPDSVDRETGQPIGCYLSSVALTNDPFVRGMVPISTPLAAERYVDFYDVPRNCGELVEALRALFGLPELAPLADVLRELTTLRAVAAGQMPAPTGTDVQKLVGGLRRLFNLPTISTAAEVFAECDKLLGAVAAEEALDEAAEPPSARLPLTAATMRATRQKDTAMDTAALFALLATHLKCAATPDAIAAHAPLFFEAAAKEKKDGGDAIMKLKAICSAMGVQDPDAAIEQYKGMQATVHALESAFPELATAFNGEVAAEDASAEEDMKMAASRMGALADAEALLLMRTRNIDLAPLPVGGDGKVDHRPLLDPAKRAALFAALRDRKAAGEAFRAKLGASGGAGQTKGKPQSALFQRWTPETADQRGRPIALEAHVATLRDPNAIDVDLSDASPIDGANPGMRAFSYVRAYPEKFGLPKGATFEQQHLAATELRNAWAEATQYDGGAEQNTY